RRVLAGVAAAALLVVTGCTSERQTSTSTPTPPARGTSPRVQVSTIESRLSYPWDLTFTPDRPMLLAERPGANRVPPPAGPRHRGAEPPVPRRQDPAGAPGRQHPDRQPLLRDGRQRPVRLHIRAPQRAGSGAAAGHRPDVDRRARAGPRRRGQRRAEGRQLRL